MVSGESGVLTRLCPGTPVVGVQRGDGVKVGDPCLTGGGVGLGGHHVDLVVDDVAGDDRADRGGVHDRGMFGVALADVDDLEFVPVEIERAIFKQARKHRTVRDLAGKAAVPILS